MNDQRLKFSTQLPGDDPAGWLSALEDVAEDHGYFEFLGPTHSAAFLDAGPKLLVTFENAEMIRGALPDAEPRGFRHARVDAWSHLALISEGESWFRDGFVYRYFDRLVDDGFFEDFDQVLFYGAHAAGYAAAAFSVAAPGARVLAIRPQATLNPRVAGWDSRYASHRRLNFDDRYGYAPEMIDAAHKAHIVFNPSQRFDAMHAALFTKPNVELLRAEGLGVRLDAAFDALHIHDDMLRAAMADELTGQSFARQLKARKDFPMYQRTLLKRARAQSHPRLAANICAYVLRSRDDPYFAAELEALGAAGVTPSHMIPASAAE